MGSCILQLLVLQGQVAFDVSQLCQAADQFLFLTLGYLFLALQHRIVAAKIFSNSAYFFIGSAVI